MRPFKLSDAKEVQRLAGDRAIADITLHVPHPYEDDVAEGWINTHAPKYASGYLAAFAMCGWLGISETAYVDHLDKDVANYFEHSDISPKTGSGSEGTGGCGTVDSGCGGCGGCGG